MDNSRKMCRICYSESEFNILLSSNYCHKTKLLEKIHVCLNNSITIDEDDYASTICYKCTENVERYYDFVTKVKKAQQQSQTGKYKKETRHGDVIRDANVHTRHTYVREEIIDAADLTFSFLEMSNDYEEKKEKNSSLLFSYPSDNAINDSFVDFKKKTPSWKTPKQIRYDTRKPSATPKYSGNKKRGYYSDDIFDTQTQEGESQFKPNWKLTPDENIITKIRNKCFGSNKM